MMGKEVVVELGGREFTIRELPMKRSREWRERLGEPVREVIGRLQGAEELELANLSEVGTLVESVGGALLGSVDLVAEVTFEYSPELAGEREWIEANAYDSEMMGAFVEVVKLAFPFGKISEMVGGLLEAASS
jgi:hypothetical protein